LFGAEDYAEAARFASLFSDDNPGHKYRPLLEPLSPLRNPQGQNRPSQFH
jgi:hypothetical protein